MNLVIKHIRVDELNDFVHSDEFNKLAFEPISKYRALSYTKNPRAESSDTALLLAYDNENLIGYLGMFTDHIRISEEVIKICWFSCMWVLPEYRRSGIAFQLLNEGHSAFNGRVMITNYIPRSKAAFYKTGNFQEFRVLDGYRFYFRFDLKNILTRKYHKAKYLSWLLASVDLNLNKLINIRFKLKKREEQTNYSFTFIDKIDTETAQFLEQFAGDSLFERSAAEFNWMLDYPWIHTIKDASIDYSKYYFSQFSLDFKQWMVKIRNQKKELTGFLILTRHKGELKTPYVLLKEDPDKDLGLFFSDFANKHQIKTVITYNQPVVKAILDKRDFMLKRKSEYGFLASNMLLKELTGVKKRIFEGDGDSAFT